MDPSLKGSKKFSENVSLSYLVCSLIYKDEEQKIRTETLEILSDYQAADGDPNFFSVFTREYLSSNQGLKNSHLRMIIQISQLS